jgi:hypothetical protein
MTYENDLKRNVQLNTHEKERELAAANWNSAVARLVRIIGFLFMALEMLLAARVILHGLGANAQNVFANVIYQFSQPFVNVFVTLFRNPQVGPGAVLELTTLVAMFAYAALGWFIGRVVWLLLSRPR